MHKTNGVMWIDSGIVPEYIIGSSLDRTVKEISTVTYQAVLDMLKAALIADQNRQPLGDDLRITIGAFIDEIEDNTCNCNPDDNETYCCHGVCIEELRCDICTPPNRGSTYPTVQRRDEPIAL